MLDAEMGRSGTLLARTKENCIMVELKLLVRLLYTFSRENAVELVAGARRGGGAAEHFEAGVYEQYG